VALWLVPREEQGQQRVIDGLDPSAWTVSVHPGSFQDGATVNVTIGPDQGLVDLELHGKAR
jgi:hypothetical protein